MRTTCTRVSEEDCLIHILGPTISLQTKGVFLCSQDEKSLYAYAGAK